VLAWCDVYTVRWFTSFPPPIQTDQHDKAELLLKVYFINDYHWINTVIDRGRNCKIDIFHLPRHPVTITVEFVTSIAARADV
jgi:hypothetical protein